MASAENYISVTGVLLERREKSLRIHFSNQEAWKWLPRWCLEFYDRVTIAKPEIGSTITIRILDRIAQEKGLV